MLKTGQEDSGNPEMVQKYGCDLWSHWTYVELLKKQEIFVDALTVGKEYAKLLDNGIKEIDADCTIEDGEALFNVYGIKAKQVLDPITKSSHISPNFTPKEGQIVILCYHWDEKGFIHFAPGKVDKTIMFDPIARGSNTIKNGYLHSLRIYDVLSVS